MIEQDLDKQKMWAELEAVKSALAAAQCVPSGAAAGSANDGASVFPFRRASTPALPKRGQKPNLADYYITGNLDGVRAELVP